ncbi:MAG: hypothetical protein H7644_05390 [Candidatus Heimdallarchaeota archaeon]|nr:hypothetical protein [Candidatus Heimdallarchaeota archaeon]MCK5143179.1 hypothetical protein [Candidatus Heimdallarchaeota archaeon]
MSPSKESDDSVAAGADLLLKGWKMINKACPVCVEPLYEKDGKVVCVKCKKEYVLVDSKSEMPPTKTSEVQQPAENSSPNNFSSYDFSSLPPALADTAKIMLEKITDLNAKLKETSDPKEISSISSSIRSLIDSLRSLSS